MMMILMIPMMIIDDDCRWLMLIDDDWWWLIWLMMIDDWWWWWWGGGGGIEIDRAPFPQDQFQITKTKFSLFNDACHDESLITNKMEVYDRRSSSEQCAKLEGEFTIIKCGKRSSHDVFSLEIPTRSTDKCITKKHREQIGSKLPSSIPGNRHHAASRHRHVVHRRHQEVISNVAL